MMCANNFISVFTFAHFAFLKGINDVKDFEVKYFDNCFMFIFKNWMGGGHCQKRLWVVGTEEKEIRWVLVLRKNASPPPSLLLINYEIVIMQQCNLQGE